MKLEIGQFAELAILNQNTNSVEYRWADPRDILSIEVIFNISVLTQCIKSIHYWQANWPKNRLKPGEKFGSGRSGWKSQDDWYKGIWREADCRIESKPDHIRIDFHALNQKEFQDEDYPVKFRRTLKIRLDFVSDFAPKDLISMIKIFTVSNVERHGFKLISSLPKPSAPFSEYRAETFNGWFSDTSLELEKIHLNDHVQIYGVVSERVDSYDNSVITILPMASESQAIAHFKGFSFSLAELHTNKFMLLPDFGLAIVQPECSDDYHALERKILNHEGDFIHAVNNSVSLNGKCVYDRIFDLPERVFEDAMAEFAKKSIFYGVIGCEGVRSKAAVSPTGEITIPKQFLVRIPRKDTPGVFWDMGYARIRFRCKIQGYETENVFFQSPTTRTIDSGYYPIINTQWASENTGLRIKQSIFATLLDGTKPGIEPQGDDIIVALMQIELENSSDRELKGALELEIGQLEEIRTVESPVVSLFNSVEITSNPEKESSFIIDLTDTNSSTRPKYSFIVDTMPRLTPFSLKTSTEKADQVVFDFDLDSNRSAVLIFKVPLLSLAGLRKENKFFGLKPLNALNFETELQLCKQYWDHRLAVAASLTIPNEEFNLFYKAHLIHVLLTNDRDIGSDRIIGRVGSTGYGCYANEVCMITMNLDQRGLFDVSRRMLQTFIDYQSTTGLDGNYEDIDGIFFGAGGYESGSGYNQNQGFVLWAIVHHVLYSQNFAWLHQIKESLLKGCQWIISEREIFARQDQELRHNQCPWISKPIQSQYLGLLPPGGVEDIQDYWCWLSTNAYNAYGLLIAGWLLMKAGISKGETIYHQGIEYHSAVRHAFLEASFKSPVIILRNGHYIPHFPCRVPLRGRGFGWIQETLEGAIHLLRCQIFSPCSQEATWIIKDHEDNLYLSDLYGYPYVGDNFEKFWFSRGGFSMQPFLLCNHLLYSMRNEPKHFLRAVFNAFAVNYRPDMKMFTEHPLPTMFDWFGHHFKTSDEAQFIDCLHTMLVQETFSKYETQFIDKELNCNDFSKFALVDKNSFLNPDSLRLLGCIPQVWLNGGKRIEFHNFVTIFGLCSFVLHNNETKSALEFEFTNKNILIQNGNLRPPLQYLFMRINFPNLSSQIIGCQAEIQYTPSPEFISFHPARITLNWIEFKLPEPSKNVNFTLKGRIMYK